VSRYVQKLRVPVRVSQRHREARDGWFLLSPERGGEGQPESILELLNSPRVVVPFIVQQDPNIVLLTIAHIDWVVVDAEVDANLVSPRSRPVSREQRVELHFTDRRHVEGIIQWDASEDALRLSDFLNGPDDFFMLRTPTGPILVNRRRVAETRVAESSPRPAQVGPVPDLAPLPPFKPSSPPS
jgi:hypothetical protein